MSKKESKSTQSSHIIAIVIYALAYIAILYFAQFVLNGAIRGKMMAQYANSPELATKTAMLSAGAGTLAQIQTLLSAFIVLACKKKGYITAILCNIFNTTVVLAMAVKQHNVSAIPGFIVPISAVVLVTIIHIYATKVSQKTNELSKSYEQLMETNRIIKDKDEKLSYLAYYDVLTSLPNRHLFIEKMDESIVNNANMPFTVILCDLDNFKMINNTYGSSSGDVLLATYAEKFKGLCDDSVFLGRIGGNEYGFIVQGNNSEANILNFIQKIQNVLSEPVQIGSDVISSTASFGIASYPNNAVSSSEILTCINSAVSYAKSNGKNRPCFYEQY
jgi:diguanylate cyclase (GGDEF)-like protein